MIATVKPNLKYLSGFVFAGNNKTRQKEILKLVLSDFYITFFISVVLSNLVVY